MRAILLLAAVLGVFGPAGHGSAEPRTVSIVAAENFYGDIAGQIGGPGVAATSILSSPDQDPHLFEASPSTARAVADADIVVFNGLDYDPWMAKLLRAGRSGRRQVIVVSELLGRKAGSNPHLWYDPAAVPAVARAIAAALVQADGAQAEGAQAEGTQAGGMQAGAMQAGGERAAGYARRLAAFNESWGRVNDRIAALRGRFAGQAVTATEPVFGLMAAALGLAMRNERFQLAVMNGTEPRPSDVAAFEADLRGHKVRVLLYNSQATGSAVQRLLLIARQSGVPVVGITETEPAGTRFQDWMLGQLAALEAALSAP